MAGPEQNSGIRVITGYLMDTDYFDHDRDMTYEVKVGGRTMFTTRLIVNRKIISLVTE